MENKRLVALDVFRGMTLALMLIVNNPGDWGQVFDPFLHADWHGCTLTDLVFPFFLFIVGVAIPLAFSSRQIEGFKKGPLSQNPEADSLDFFDWARFKRVSLLQIRFYSYSGSASANCPGVWLCGYFVSAI